MSRGCFGKRVPKVPVRADKIERGCARTKEIVRTTCMHTITPLAGSSPAPSTIQGNRVTFTTFPGVEFQESSRGLAGIRRTGERLNGISGVYCAILRFDGRCYVGSTVNLSIRLSAHMGHAARGSVTAFHRALREFGPDAFDFEILERCPREQLLEREEFYIALLNAASIHGFNTMSRALATYGRVVLPATRERQRIALLGRKRSPEVCRRIGEANRGRKLSPEQVEKMRKASTGRRHSAEAVAKMRGRKHRPESIEKMRRKQVGKKMPASMREKMRVAMTGRKRSPESVAKSRAGVLGKKRTEEQRQRLRGRIVSAETRAKIGAANRGRRKSPETIAKWRAKVIGRKHTPEVLARMTEFQRNRRATERAAKGSGANQKKAARPPRILGRGNGGKSSPGSSPSPAQGLLNLS